jgi:hypothetical protein
MAHWIEIPAHRIYVVTGTEFRNEFSRIGADGAEPKEAEATAIIVRDRDRKCFKPARFDLSGSVANDCICLEDL